jgi:hypothetical protein
MSLAGSENADRVPVTCTPSTHPDATITCAPTAPPAGGLQPLDWEVCVVARPCCGPIPGEGPPLTVTFAGADPFYANGAVTVPIDAQVAKTGFLRCWWLPLLLFALFVGFVWFVLGWVRPHGFDPSLSMRVAGSEAALKRTAAFILAEQPGGRRGFYRSARVSVDGEGNALRRTNQAVLVLTAGAGGQVKWTKAGGVEKKDRRKNTFVPLDAADRAEGAVAGTIYRVGNLYFKLG